MALQKTPSVAIKSGRWKEKVTDPIGFPIPSRTGYWTCASCSKEEEENSGGSEAGGNEYQAYLLLEKLKLLGSYLLFLDIVSDSDPHGKSGGYIFRSHIHAML